MVARRRAPRLAPHEHLASQITRRGRFLARDPAVGRPLPRIWRVMAVLGWVALVGEAYRRAWRGRPRGE